MFKNKFGELRSGWTLALAMVFVAVSQGILLIIDLLLGIILPENLSQGINTALMVILTPLSSVLMFIVCPIAFRVMYGKRPLGQMGLSKKRWLSDLAKGLALGIVLMAIVFAVLYISGNVVIDGVNPGIIASAEYLSMALLFIAVGFAEEALSRGIMMTALKTTRNRFFIIALPSIIFGALHILNANVSVAGILNVMLAGLMFAVLFIRTGSIWMPIGVHITWNFFQGNVFGMNVSGMDTISVIESTFTGSDFLTGGEFGAEGGIVVTAILLITIALSFILIKPPSDSDWTMSSDLPLTRIKK